MHSIAKHFPFLPPSTPFQRCTQQTILSNKRALSPKSTPNTMPLSKHYLLCTDPGGWGGGHGLHQVTKNKNMYTLLHTTLIANKRQKQTNNIRHDSESKLCPFEKFDLSAFSPSVRDREREKRRVVFGKGAPNIPSGGGVESSSVACLGSSDHWPVTASLSVHTPPGGGGGRG